MGIHLFEPAGGPLAVDLSLVEWILDRCECAERRAAEAACITVALKARACVTYMSEDTSWLDSMGEGGFRVYFECFRDCVVILHIERPSRPLTPGEGAFVVRRNALGHAYRYPGAGEGPSAVLVLRECGHGRNADGAFGRCWTGTVKAGVLACLADRGGAAAAYGGHHLRALLEWAAAHGLVSKGERSEGNRSDAGAPAPKAFGNDPGIGGLHLRASAKGGDDDLRSCLALLALLGGDSGHGGNNFDAALSARLAIFLAAGGLGGAALGTGIVRLCSEQLSAGVADSETAPPGASALVGTLLRLHGRMIDAPAATCDVRACSACMPAGTEQPDGPSPC